MLKSCVLLLLYTPVAYNCTEVPFATDAVAGVVDPCVVVRTMLCSVGGLTVSTNAGEVMPFKLAVMFDVPGATDVARPPLAIVAAAVLLEAQVTVPLMSAVLRSLYVPWALNCSVPGSARLIADADTAIETRVGELTVSVKAGEVMPFRLALMFDVPAPADVARPPVVIVATAVLLEAQVTPVVITA